MNIYLHELKSKLKSMAIWAVSIAAVIFIYQGAFSSLSADASMMQEMLDQFPKELLMAFGMDSMDLTTVLGFYGVAFLFAQICFAIQASNYGFSLVSIEERELTADFLLAKPVSRSKILTSKLLAAFTALTASNLITWASSFTIIEVVRNGREYDAKALILVLSTVVLFQLFFLSVGMLISLLVKRLRAVTPYSMALSIGLYVLSAFGGMLGDDSLEIISPFKHFDPNYIIANLKYDLPLVMISVVVILIAIPASYILYNRRNIASAV
jgi:ABC-2 type transport system permease protein